MTKVDVLIPAYNAAHFLPRALESVLAQTEPGWQIMLVDDGSTDNTRAVVEEFVRTHEEQLQGRLTYLYQPNRGLPAARNTGIRNSSSPFLALLDADDIWLRNRLAESLASFANKPNVGLSYSGFSRFDESGKVLDTFTTSDMGAPGEMATRLYTRAVHLPCPTVTFRRASLQTVGLFDESMRATEDRDMWLRIAQHYDVVFVPKVLALYRSSSSSMSGDLPRMLQAQRQFIAKHYGEPGCGWLAQRMALATTFQLLAESYSARHQHRPAIRYALQAVLMTPFRGPVLRTAAAMLLRALRRQP
jgi:glycosyltransferase involved in cell wall biosynthesis